VNPPRDAGLRDHTMGNLLTGIAIALGLSPLVACQSGIQSRFQIFGGLRAFFEKRQDKIAGV
jgi:hypothetical protein